MDTSLGRDGVEAMVAKAVAVEVGAMVLAVGVRGSAAGWFPWSCAWRGGQSVMVGCGSAVGILMAYCTTSRRQ